MLRCNLSISSCSNNRIEHDSDLVLSIALGSSVQSHWFRVEAETSYYIYVQSKGYISHLRHCCKRTDHLRYIKHSSL